MTRTKRGGEAKAHSRSVSAGIDNLHIGFHQRKEHQLNASTVRTTLKRYLPAALVPLGALVLVIAAATPALAQTTGASLTSVIDQLRNILVGILAGLATLFLTIGGIRYMTAGGDPGHVEKAKTSLKSAAIGYGLAALAPVLVNLLKTVVPS